LALVRADVSKELRALIIRVTGIDERGTTSVLARTTRRNIPEDAILHTHSRKNLKSQIFSVVYRPRAIYYFSPLNINVHSPSLPHPTLNVSKRCHHKSLLFLPNSNNGKTF
jgi:hypothetical protein